MSRYNLVEHDKPTIEFQLIRYNIHQERKSKQRSWFVGLLIFTTLIGAIVLSNPMPVQQLIQKHVASIPSFIDRLRSTNPNIWMSAATVQKMKVIEADVVVGNQDKDISINTATLANNTALTPNVGLSVKMPKSLDTKLEDISITEDTTVTEEATTIVDEVDKKEGDSGVASSASEAPSLLINDSIIANRPVGYNSTLLQLQSGDGAIAVVNVDGSNVLGAPAGIFLDALTAGEIVSISGRTSNNRWLMTTNDQGQIGWVSANTLVIFGSENLPITSDSMVEGIDQLDSPDSGLAGYNSTLAQGAISSRTTAAADPARLMDSDLGKTAYAIVGSQDASLHSEPSGEIIRSLPLGSMFDAVGRSADEAWLYTATNDGTSGWVSAEDVVAFRVDPLPIISAIVQASGQDKSVINNTTSSEVLSSDSPSGNTQLETTNSSVLPFASVMAIESRLNIRGGPGTTYRIIGKALSGDVFRVLGRDQNLGWVQIELTSVSDKFGWVSSRYITLNESITSLPVVNQVNFSAPPYSEANN